MEHMLTKGPLLDSQGHLTEAGYATSLVKEYRRGDIKASGFRIKEWDYYLIYNDRFGIALTLDVNSYMSMLSASILDFENATETTVSPIGVMPMGKTNLPSTSESGVITITTSATEGRMESIRIRVPAMVITPVKSCVKPMSKPSAKVSTSPITRLTVSPCGWASR